MSIENVEDAIPIPERKHRSSGRIDRLWKKVTPRGSNYRRHALLSSIASMGLYGTGVATGPIMARVLGPSGRGDFAAVMAPASVLVWVLAFGFPTAAAYFVGDIPEEKLLVAATAFGVVVGTPVCLGLWFIAPAYLAGHSAVAVLWARVVLAVVPLSVGMSAALEVSRRLNPGASWNCWRSAPIFLPALGTLILAAVGELTLQTALAVTLLGFLVPLALLATRLWRRRPLPRPSLTVLGAMLPYAWRTAATAAATSLTSRLDQVVLVAIVPSSQLGLYAVAVTIASVTSPVTSGLNLALFGHLRGENSKIRALARYRRAVFMTLVLSTMVAAGLWILAPLLLRLAFGPDFMPAGAALRLLLPGSVAFDVLGVLGTRLLTDGRPGEASRAAILGAGITVVGLLALVPHFGILGAAAVTSGAFAAQVIFLVARGALRSSELVLDTPSPLSSATGAR